MKQLLYILCLICLPLSIQAEVIGYGTCGKYGDNVNWVLEDDTLTLSGSGAMQDYNSYLGYNDVPWHDYRERIAEVRIAYGITSIAEGMCYGCEKLQKIDIPNSVVEIGRAAFMYCVGFTAVEIPNSVTKIGMSAFCSCTKLKSVVIPSSVVFIGGGAFARCSELSTILLPNGLTEIEPSTFSSCDRLTSVVIPEGVKRIGVSAFQDCTQLLSVEIPSSVKEIGRNAFWGCVSVTDLFCYAVYPPDVEWYFYQFRNNYTDPLYTILHVPAQSVGDYAATDSWNQFYDILPIADVAIQDPNSSSKIYYSCNEETKTASVTSGPAKYTDDCVIPKTIRYNGDVYKVREITKYAFMGSKTLKSVTMSDNITEMGKYAFADCVSMTDVTFSKYLTEIDDYTFSGCSSLGSVTIPDRVKTIGEGAFADCKNLQSVYLPRNLTTLSCWAFSGCSALKTIRINGTTGVFAENAFDGCVSLEHIYLSTAIVPEADEDAFANANYNATLHVPTEAVDAYKTTAPWCYFKHIVALNEQDDSPYLMTIQYTFNKETMTATVSKVVTQNTDKAVIPATTEFEGETYRVTAIDMKAFFDNQNLVSIELPEGITEIGIQAFLECSSLTSFIVPNSVKEIKQSAFASCRAMTKCVFGSGVSNIESSVFVNDYDITDIYCLAEKVPSTNREAFFEYLYPRATVHVPAQSLEEYKTTAPWSYFSNIVAIAEGETDGINEIVNGKWSNSKSIYNLQGQRINRLQKGLNIVDGKKVWVR